MPNPLARKLDSIKQHGGISSREIAQLLDTTPETVSRWRKKKAGPRPDSLEKLLALEWLMDQLAEFYEPEEARLWLFAHHRLLGGDRPADRIQQGRPKDVVGLIDQLKDGAFV